MTENALTYKFVQILFIMLNLALQNPGKLKDVENGAAQPSRTPVTAKDGNLVEPLSNGLLLAMTMDEIKHKFGEPSERTRDARTFKYPTFDVQCGGRRGEIWRVKLKRGVKLNSGVGIGSSRAEAARLFGDADIVIYDQYKIYFEFSDDAVSEIKIEPAQGSFAPYKRNANQRSLRAPGLGAQASDDQFVEFR